MTMTKKDLFEAFADIPDDETIKVCIADGAEHLDELEPGSLLEITDTGYTNAGYVLYVDPK